MSSKLRPVGTLAYLPPPALPGSPPSTGALRLCTRCQRDANERGGVQVTPTRWCCSPCWMSCAAGTNPNRKRLLKPD